MKKKNRKGLGGIIDQVENSEANGIKYDLINITEEDILDFMNEIESANKNTGMVLYSINGIGYLDEKNKNFIRITDDDFWEITPWQKIRLLNKKPTLLINTRNGPDKPEFYALYLSKIKAIKQIKKYCKENNIPWKQGFWDKVKRVLSKLAICHNSTS